MVRHDPLIVVGLILVCLSVLLFVYVQLKMRETGYDTFPFFSRPRDWKLPAEYLKVRVERGWSPWPVYLMLPCLVVGMAVLVIGLSRL